MSELEKCPKCSQAIYTTYRIKLASVSVLLAFVPSVAILLLLYYIITTLPAHGKAGGYLMIGAVGFVGYIFTKFVKKERFKVESCTRCDFILSTKIDLKVE